MNVFWTKLLFLISLRYKWEWRASVPRENRPSPAAGGRPKTGPSGQRAQVHGHLPETADILLALQRFYLVSNTSVRSHAVKLLSGVTQPNMADMLLCHLIGVCWGSRATSVRVSTFLGHVPISQVTLHFIYYWGVRTQEGIIGCWLAAVIWAWAKVLQYQTNIDKKFCNDI